MDKQVTSSSQQFIDFQAQSKYFFDTAQQCFDHCVTDFSSKVLTPQEKDCSKSCFVK